MHPHLYYCIVSIYHEIYVLVHSYHNIFWLFMIFLIVFLDGWTCLSFSSKNKFYQGCGVTIRILHYSFFCVCLCSHPSYSFPPSHELHTCYDMDQTWRSASRLGTPVQCETVRERIEVNFRESASVFVLSTPSTFNQPPPSFLPLLPLFLQCLRTSSPVCAAQEGSTAPWRQPDSWIKPTSQVTLILFLQPPCGPELMGSSGRV